MKNLLQKILWIVGLMISAFTFGSLLGQLHWILDLLSHFHLQYIAVLTIAVLLLLLFREQRRWVLILLPALFVNLFLVAPFFVPKASVLDDPDTKPLRVMSMNISTSNEGYPQVVELIRQRQPDIIFMSEVRNDLVALLETELSTSYPLQYAEPSRMTLGLAILARDPEMKVQTLISDETGRRRRYLRADFQWRGQSVTLAGIHPLPPMRGAWAYGRDRELATMSELAVQTDHPFILIGDLNASPWSHAMRALVAEAGLRYATDGYGIWPTWFVGNPLLDPLVSAPLDHILVSSEWQVVDYMETGDIGSDHVPLQADLVIRE